MDCKTFSFNFFLLLLCSIWSSLLHILFMDTLKVGSLHVNDARDGVKRGLVAEVVKQKRINVCFFARDSQQY